MKPTTHHTEYSLPFDTHIEVRLDSHGQKTVSLESQLAQAISLTLTTEDLDNSHQDVIENARIVGVIEGIEQLLMSLAKVGIRLDEPIYAQALTDCIHRIQH
jgi:hypothetical protein